MALAVDRAAVWAFLWRFLLLLAFLLAPWPVVPGVFAGAFTNVAALVAPNKVGDRVELEFALGPGSPWESVLSAHDLASDARIQVPIESRSLVYVPLSVFLSLALATPIPPTERRREMVILFGGIAAMLVLLALLTAVPILALLGGGSPVRAFGFGRATLTALDLVQRILIAPPGMAYVLPALVWSSLVLVTRTRR